MQWIWKRGSHRQRLIALLFILAMVQVVGTSCFRLDVTAKGSDQAVKFLKGTWQTGSMGYEYNGTTQAMYYVKFTKNNIKYGHMNGNKFVLDHQDKIAKTKKLATGGYRIQATTADGVKYMYQSAVSDMNALEYYDTWDTSDLGNHYYGTSSLWK